MTRQVVVSAITTVAFAPLLLLAACSKSGADAAPDSTTVAASTTNSPTLPDRIVGPQDLTEQGIGPVRIGMTLAEVAGATSSGIRLVGTDSIECSYLSWRDGPPGVLIMAEGGYVVRIDVRNPSIATADGVKIGSTEDEVQQRYSGRVAVQPHKYSDGHYLVVTPREPADSNLRIVFETDGKKVETFRSGLVPQVQYVEGCS